MGNCPGALLCSFMTSLGTYGSPDASLVLRIGVGVGCNPIV